MSKTDGDSPVLIDAATNLPTISNMDLSGLSHDKNRPSFATSVSQSHSQQSSQQTQAKDTPACKSKLQLFKEKEFSKVYISSLTKEEREQCLRELFKSMQSDKICKSCSKFKSGDTMKSVKTNLSEDETPENIKKFFTTTEKRNFSKKKEQFMVVYGNPNLLINHMIAQCPTCGNLVNLGHINNIMIDRRNKCWHKSLHLYLFYLQEK